MADRDAGADPAPPDEELGRLWASSYDDLRQLARARLRRNGPLTLLDTTGLVNEAYLRVAGGNAAQFPDRGRFFAYSAAVMRSVIINMVRESQAEKRGGPDRQQITLMSGLVAAGDPEDVVIRVHEALSELAAIDERLCRVVEMRYFGGFDESEIALALGITDRTVRRDWQKARLLLRGMMS